MTSWAKGYLICFAIIVFGCLLVNISGTGSLREMEERDTALVREGRKVTATIVRMQHGGGKFPYHNVFYRFQMAGKTYDGWADPGAVKYLQMRVGGPIEVTYLPSNPNVSDYDPQKWLDSQANSKVGAYVVIALGVAAVLVTAIADLLRRQAGVDYSSPVQTLPTSSGPVTVRTYRPYVVILLVGAIFFCAGAFFQFQLIKQIVTDEPMPMTVTINGRTTEHLMSRTEKSLWAFFPVPFWAIGLYFILFWKNYRVSTTPDHILITGTFGKRFDRAWSDIHSVRRYTNKGTNYYKLGDGATSATVIQSLTNYDELEAEIKRRLADKLGFPNRSNESYDD